MIGNAVPVQFAYNIAKKIFSDLSKVINITKTSYMVVEKKERIRNKFLLTNIKYEKQTLN